MLVTHPRERRQALAARTQYTEAMSILSRARTQRAATVRRDHTPAEVHAHHAAIHEIVQRWMDGEFGRGDAAMATKRALIEDENRFFWGTPMPELPAPAERPAPRPALALVQGRFHEDEDEREQFWWNRD